jgi:hypothetical protein
VLHAAQARVAQQVEQRRAGLRLRLAPLAVDHISTMPEVK